jgi:hypothetical protein
MVTTETETTRPCNRPHELGTGQQDKQCAMVKLVICSIGQDKKCNKHTNDNAIQLKKYMQNIKNIPAKVNNSHSNVSIPLTIMCVDTNQCKSEVETLKITQ